MTIKVAELFAGVGGFRLGLEGTPDGEFAGALPPAGDFLTVWANQWEPPGANAKQFAYRCYEARFGAGTCVNGDIHEILGKVERREYTIPDIDMLVGGFPCQDYSVAKPLAQSNGIEGKKGVLWWDIYKFLQLKEPRYVLLENVDRLLSSPATQRGRDFAIILSCLNLLGYDVEWRIINSADYGFPQRRKRTFIYGQKNNDNSQVPLAAIATEGLFAQAFPIKPPTRLTRIDLPADPYVVTKEFPAKQKSPFLAGGAMRNGETITFPVTPNYVGEYTTLGSILEEEESVSEEFFINPEQVSRWEYLKGSKSEQRINKKTGVAYRYSEGKISFPILRIFLHELF